MSVRKSKTFLGDLHLGVRRAEHTISKSQAALAQYLFDLAVEIAQEAKERLSPVYQAGDMFDRHSNKESVVLQGMKLAALLERAMGGNHDQLNIAGAIGSLHLVKEAMGEKGQGSVIILNDDMSQPYAFTEVTPGPVKATSITIVPHALTQDLFEQSLREAVRQAEENEGCFKILMLHCNVGDNFGHTEAEGSTLSLTVALQKEMEETFDLILVGHEHEPDHRSEKTIILGNIFPLSFGEISDRYVWDLDLTTFELTQTPIFVASEQYMRLDVEIALNGNAVIGQKVQLLEIVGSIKAIDYPALSRAIQGLWHDNDGLLALKNSVDVERSGKAEKSQQETFIPKSLRETVAESIQKTPYADAYAEIEAEVER